MSRAEDRAGGALVTVPASFREMPRWWREGTEWLDHLPALVEAQCRRWGLLVDGPPHHGSNALVVPVTRNGERLALRMAPPGDDTRSAVAALRFWGGNGTVLLLDSDPERGAQLLERLDGSHTLAAEPLEAAIRVVGRLMRELARPVPGDVPSTGTIAGSERATMRARWLALGRPIPKRQLDAAVDAAGRLTTPATPDLAVNGDLHFEQVLAGKRRPWLVVDPLLLRGDIDYDAGRILWSRLDEMGGNATVRRALAVLVDAAGLVPDHARTSVVYRSASYLLWGLEHGLTEDPVRCRRLLDVFV